MRFLTYRQSTNSGIAIENARGELSGLGSEHPHYPGSLDDLVGNAQSLEAAAVAIARYGQHLIRGELTYLPPIQRPGKILCIGLNYMDHSLESGFEVPSYPTVFARFATSLVGHAAPILRPSISEQLDWEGELAVVIGRGGREIARSEALSHVGGYSIFNDASIRDYQFKTTQWTMGKNFDATGAMGPVLVTPDEVPPGCRGVRLTTSLNGTIVQNASTHDLVFDVATLIHLLSQVMTLEAGDVISTGTPAGVGVARKPPVFMTHGDRCEVSIEGIGTLANPIVAAG
jgi:2-keto-4-pentenoate hydratase/2-oxohepta-3-ene-1,7-dioic acid hydratase in catechol pathway